MATEDKQPTKTVLLCGGGTGGHIVPTLAVAAALRAESPTVRLVYVSERGGKFDQLIVSAAAIDQHITISAGKFRRYHGESWLRRLTDIRTIAWNVRDVFRTLIGFVQAFVMLRRVRPSVIFLKGGFVCVPVGVAAAVLRIPFYTHDSDTIPGLANRIVGKWAKLHLTGMPTALYNSYLPETMRFTGTPLSAEFKLTSTADQQRYRKQLDIPADKQVIVITGGSQGAQRLNQLVKTAVLRLLRERTNLFVIHQVGATNMHTYADAERHDRLRVESFLSPMHVYTGAADMVITRGSATLLAEAGAQGRACLVIPNPELAGGHQVVNTKYFADAGALIAVSEADAREHADEIEKQILRLLDDSTLREKLGLTLRSLSMPSAATDIAKVLLDAINGSHNREASP